MQAEIDMFPSANELVLINFSAGSVLRSKYFIKKNVYDLMTINLFIVILWMDFALILLLLTDNYVTELLKQSTT